MFDCAKYETDEPSPVSRLVQFACVSEKKRKKLLTLLEVRCIVNLSLQNITFQMVGMIAIVYNYHIREWLGEAQKYR